MKNYSTKDLYNIINILSITVTVLIIVFTLNLALVTDAMMFVAFFVICGAASAWLISTKGAVLAVTASMVGWGLSLMLTDSAALSALSLSYLPISVALSFVNQRKISRSSAIGIGSAFITISSVAVLIYITVTRTGGFSLSNITMAFPHFFKQVKELLYTSFYVNIAGTDYPIIAESNVGSYFNFLICLFPAVISAIATVLGFMTAFVYKKVIVVTSLSSITSKEWDLLPSSVTSAVFLICSLIFAFIDNTNAISLTAVSIIIILIPGILIAGFTSCFKPIITDGIIRPRILRPLTVIISLFSSISAFAVVCVIYGIYDSIVSSLPKRKPTNQD